MKKLISVLIVFSLLVVFAACGDNESGTTVSAPSESSVSVPSVSSEADVSDTSEDVSSNTSTDDGSADFSDDSSDVSDNSETSDTSDVSVPDTSDEECKHSKTKMVNSRESTCSVKGYSGDTVCNDCGETVKKGRELSLNDNHSIVFESKSATCTEGGYKDKKICKDCGCEVSKGTIVNALGHDTYTEGNAVKCKRCGEVISTIATSTPYFVEFRFVSKTQPNSFEVDGMPVLDRLYGKNKAAQMGDTFVYEIVMSDGSIADFEVFAIHGCTATIDGNFITLHITGKNTNAVYSIITVDKNGKEVAKSINIDTVIMSEHGLEYDGLQLREYARRQGMKWLNGSDRTDGTRIDVVIEGKTDSVWYSEALAAIDGLAKSGHTQFCYQLVYPYDFQIIAYK